MNNIKTIEKKLKKDGFEVVSPKDGTLQLWGVLDYDYIQIEVISNGKIELATENSSVQVDTYEDIFQEMLEYILNEIDAI